MSPRVLTRTFSLCWAETSGLLLSFKRGHNFEQAFSKVDRYQIDKMEHDFGGYDYGEDGMSFILAGAATLNDCGIQLKQTVKIAPTTVARIGNLRVCLNFRHTCLFLRPV